MSSISAGTTSTTTLVHSGDTTGSLVFKTNDTGSGGTTAVTIDTSQNVGIGTTSPSVKLHVASSVSGYTSSLADSVTNAATLLKTNSGDSTVTSFGGTSTGIGTIQRSNGSGSSSYDIAINPFGGNLLVGTTNSNITGRGPATIVAKSNSSDTVNLYQSANTSFNIASLVATTSGTRYHIGFGDGTTWNERGTISSNGTGVTYGSNSDYRLKENVQPMVGALEKVSLLKPCTYKWKETGTNGQGFIAHELQEICPDAVAGEKDAVKEDGSPQYQNVDASYLVATLTAAIQELKAINDQQAETINALTARVVALESK